ncbi:MAG: MarR family winged helix-turn-helix transcriptional regulator [Hyphomicrobiaceae bacterium]
MTSKPERHEPEPFSTSFPYLVRRVGMRIGELFEARIAPFGITLPMYRVLASLAEEDGQRLGRLSEMTTIELSTLSRLIGAMVRRGLITRQRRADNGREVSIRLKPQGRELAEKLIPLGHRCELVALQGLKQPDVERFKALLVDAFRSLDALEQEFAADLKRLGEAHAARAHQPRAHEAAETIDASMDGLSNKNTGPA